MIKLPLKYRINKKIRTFKNKLKDKLAQSICKLFGHSDTYFDGSWTSSKVCCKRCHSKLDVKWISPRN